MTQNHSLVKIKRFDLIQSFKQNWFIPVVLCGFFTIAFPIYAKIDYENMINMAKTASSSGALSYLYYFYPKYSGLTSIITLILFFVALLSAVIALSFFFSKKKSNVFLSTTLSRRQLFINRSIACCSMLFLAIFIPLTIDLLWNISEFGFSTALLSVYLISVLAYTTFLLLGFGFGAIGAALAGNIAEAIATASCLTILPFGLLYFISRSMHQFLYGYIGHINNSITDKIYDPSPLRFAYLTPTFFFMSVKDTEFGRTTSEKYSNALLDLSSNAKPGLDCYMPVIVWMVISFAIFAVAARLLAKRKAECASSLGANTGANAIISCTISIWAVNLFLLFLGDNYKTGSVYYPKNVLNIALISFITIIVYFMCQLIITRNIKRLLRSFKSLIPVLCVTVVVPVIMYSGGFGYNKYIPKIEQIESATVNIPYEVPFHKDKYSNYYGELELIQTNPYSSISCLKTEADLRKLITLQEELIKVDKENDKYIPIVVEYMLKDGTRFSRCYTQTTNKALTDVLSMVDSDAAHNYFKLILTGIGDDSDYKMSEKERAEFEAGIYSYKSLERQKYFRNSNYEEHLNNLDYESGSLSLISNDHQISILLQEALTKDEFQALKKSLLDDMLAISFKELYMSTERPLAIIAQSSTDEKDLSDHTISNNFPIYPKMKNTIQFLKQKGLLSQVTQQEMPIAAVVSSEMNPDNIDGFKLNNNFYNSKNNYYLIPYFAPFKSYIQKETDAANALEHLYTIPWEDDKSFTTTLSKYFTAADPHVLLGYDKLFKKQNLITDSEQLKALADAAYPCYYLNQSGYFVWMEYDKETTVMFIPKDKAPDFMK